MWALVAASSPAFACGSPKLDFASDPIGTVFVVILLSPWLIREWVTNLTPQSWLALVGGVGVVLLGSVTLLAPAPKP